MTFNIFRHNFYGEPDYLYAKMGLFEKRYSREEILDKVTRKQNAIPHTSEYNSIPKIYILLPCLLVVMFVIFPIWLISFAPLVALYGLYKYQSYPKRTTQIMLEEKDVGEVGTEYGLAPDIINFDARTYDIVVFGVTGHSGSVLAEYLVERYIKAGSGLKIAVAGRTKEKISKSLQKLAKHTDYSFALDIPMIIANTTDQDSINALVRNTRVVATTVGPFLKYGEPLVRACARYGTSYCDITGENSWVQLMRAKYGSLAKASDASIVSTTGVDSIPSDIGVLNVVQKFKKSHGIVPDRVDCLIEGAAGGIGGGTIDTFVQFMDNGAPPEYELKNREKSGTTVFDSYYGLGYNRIAKQWTFPYIMAPINMKVVESTNTTLGYVPKLCYNEAMAVPSLFATLFLSLVSIIASSILYFYPTRLIMFETGIIAKPSGAGPSRKTMSSGFLSQKFIASTKDGKREELKFKCIGDPGGMLTALFQAEIGVSLATRRNSVLSTGAGLTPGETLDFSKYTEFLKDTGMIVIE